jgi:flagellar basal-body rod protein FlgC
VPEELDNGPGRGVRVMEVQKDAEPGRLVYDPYHPDAILSGPSTGYVEYPNVNIVNEMVDLIAASRAYEANSSVIQGAKEMFSSALEIGR